MVVAFLQTLCGHECTTYASKSTEVRPRIIRSLMNFHRGWKAQNRLSCEVKITEFTEAPQFHVSPCFFVSFEVTQVEAGEKRTQMPEYVWVSADKIWPRSGKDFESLKLRCCITTMWLYRVRRSIPLKQPACVLWTMGPTALKHSVREQDVNSGDYE